MSDNNSLWYRFAWLVDNQRSCLSQEFLNKYWSSIQRLYCQLRLPGSHFFVAHFFSSSNCLLHFLRTNALVFPCGRNFRRSLLSTGCIVHRVVSLQYLGNFHSLKRASPLDWDPSIISMIYVLQTWWFLLQSWLETILFRWLSSAMVIRLWW